MDKRLWPNFSIAVISALVNGFCLLYAFRTGDSSEHPINALIIILAIALGVTLGLMITPVSSQERAAFADYAKYVATFVSGYLISKIDPVVTAVLKPDAILTAINSFRMLSFTSCFVFAVLTVYVIRSYVYLAAASSSQSDKPEWV
jgi:hypothetical protein